MPCAFEPERPTSLSRQLGHADIQMVARVYGVYAPRSDERERWEKIAAEQDAAREAQQAKKIDKLGASMGAAPQKQREPITVSDWLVDSRGGTRTRDPGIMSSSPAPGQDSLHSEDAE